MRPSPYVSIVLAINLSSSGANVSPTLRRHLIQMHIDVMRTLSRLKTAIVRRTYGRRSPQAEIAMK